VIVSDEGATIRERRRIATPREGYDAIVSAVTGFIEELVREAGGDPGSVPVGVGMPGGVTRRDRLIKNSNTVCLNGRPFRDDVQRALGRPVAFENDANCFALAEATRGAGAPYRDGVVFGVILGTGVGGGIVINGALWPGNHGIAGEWGHHAVFEGRGRRCYCGGVGCLETYASGPALEASYAERSGLTLGAREIAARRHEDPHAAAAVELFLSALARGLANVIDILDPSAIVLGGGLSNLSLLYDEGTAKVRELVFNDELTTPILKNALGDSAGVLGAALLG
jgi:fructokinase